MSTLALEPRAPRGAGDLWRPRLSRVLEAREEIAARGATKPVVTLRLERGDLACVLGQRRGR